MPLETICPKGEGGLLHRSLHRIGQNRHSCFIEWRTIYAQNTSIIRDFRGSEGSGGDARRTLHAPAKERLFSWPFPFDVAMVSQIG